jgi:molecular chaperone IbpA
MHIMRHFDFSPLYRSTVGFDRLANILDQVMTADPSQNTYPPYNIEKTGEDAYRITIAVAGFSDDELTIEAREGALVVSGRKGESDEGRPSCIAGSRRGPSSGASSSPTMCARPVR